MEYKEYKIGEKFEHNGALLQCIEDKVEYSCKGCYFKYNSDCLLISCAPNDREDRKSVIFEEVKE